jgi:large subunit ribosomal protein L18
MIEEPKQHSTVGFAMLLAGVAISSLAVGTYVGEALATTSLFVPAMAPSAVATRDVSMGAFNQRISPIDRRERRANGIRRKISGTEERPRLSVFRSNNHIYGQIIDDDAQTTLASAGTVEKDVAARVAGKNPTEAAEEVGRIIAERAQAKGIEKIVFDRNGYKYHGRVRGVAEGAREGGLVF